MRHFPDPSASAGFSLLEMAFVLAVLGGLILTAMHYRAPLTGTSDTVALGYQDQITAALFRYARRHHRLPCADTNGNGFEGGASGTCNPGEAAHMVGAVPFRTLALSDPQGITEQIRQRYVYGVFRDNSTATDLASLAERTGDLPGDSAYRSLDDLRYALRSLASRSLDASRIHVTGDGQQAGAADCSGNRIANLAFFVVYAGTRDADGDGNWLDGQNSNLGWPTGSGLCVSGPLTAEDEQYDDATVAVGFAELLGYLTQ